MYKKMKRIIMASMIAVLTVGLFLGGTVSADGEDDKVVDEKWGKPVYVYGGSLTDSEVESLAKAMGYDDMEDLESMAVTGDDIVHFLGEGNPDSNMYSSAIITRSSKGSGIEVKINTPENVTKITVDQYTNAMITAGVEDAEVLVDSPKPVTGESALTGIYKAYDEKGEELDQDRMEVAQEELETTADLSEDLDEDESATLDDAIVDIKQQLGEIKEDQITEEQVKAIVDEALEKRDLDEKLTDDQIARLVSMGYKYGQTDAITSEAVKDQLDDLSEVVGDKIGDFNNWADDVGLWEKIQEFFKSMWESLMNLINGVKEESN